MSRSQPGARRPKLGDPSDRRQPRTEACRQHADLLSDPGDLPVQLAQASGDIGRYRSKAQFAMANGTAPLTASSGRIDRHRLNRGGNRQLNRIIHFVALTQISRSPEGRAYYQRKRAQGRTTKEAIRCLKRRISDRIFVTLRASMLT